MVFEKLCREFAALNEIKAIALGGSRATDNYDAQSDYDLYLYCDGIPSEAVRTEILNRYCSYIELNNQYWETEDDCTLNNGIDIDILYRDMQDFGEGIARVVEQYQASNGYTTCMWHNLNTCKILYDETGELAALKKRFAVPYPDRLRAEIIGRNRRLLSGYLPSYEGQILKASKRHDLVAVNHRTAAFLESYFDIIFALNRKTHPGEKRMIEIAKRDANILPADFEKNIDALFENLYGNSETVAEILRSIIDHLDDVLAKSNE